MRSIATVVVSLTLALVAGCSGGKKEEAGSKGEAAKASAMNEAKAEKSDKKNNKKDKAAKKNAGPLTIPSDLAYYHGFWQGRFRHHLGTVDETLVWTPQGGLLIFAVPGPAVGAQEASTNCLVYFETQGESLTTAGDDCPLAWGLTDIKVDRLDNAAHKMTISFVWDGKTRFSFPLDQSMPATTPAAKPPANISLDMLGVGLETSFGSIDKAFKQNKSLGGDVNDYYGGDPEASIALIKQFVETKENRPAQDYYKRGYRSNQPASLTEITDTVTVYSTSLSSDGVPFALERKMTPEEGKEPSADAFRKALVDKYGEPSSSTSEYSTRLNWYFNPEGEQVRSATCSYERKDEINVINMRAKVDLSPLCGYFLGIEYITGGAGNLYQAHFLLTDVSRIVRPLLYQEYLSYTKGFEESKAKVLAAEAEHKAKREQAENADIKL